MFAISSDLGFVSDILKFPIILCADNQDVLTGRVG